MGLREDLVDAACVLVSHERSVINTGLEGNNPVALCN